MVFCPRLESTQVFISSSLQHWELSSPLFTIGIYLLSSPLVIIFSSLHHWDLSSLFTIGIYLFLSSPLGFILSLHHWELSSPLFTIENYLLFSLDNSSPVWMWPEKRELASGEIIACSSDNNNSSLRKQNLWDDLMNFARGRSHLGKLWAGTRMIDSCSAGGGVHRYIRERERRKNKQIY